MVHEQERHKLSKVEHQSILTTSQPDKDLKTDVCANRVPCKNELSLWVLFTDLQQRSDLVRNLRVQVIESPVMMIPMAVTGVLHFSQKRSFSLCSIPVYAAKMVPATMSMAASLAE